MLFRKATFADVEAMHALINHYAKQGAMLARSRNMLYETLRDFTIAENDSKVIGIGALHMIWDGLAEIRALAVDETLARQGIGRKIVVELTREAHELGVKTLFTLTYQRVFFEKLGFVVTTTDKVSQKVWKECIDCPKFPNCDEIAMSQELTPQTC